MSSILKRSVENKNIEEVNTVSEYLALLSFPREFTMFDNMSNTIRVACLIDLILTQKIYLDTQTENIRIISKSTEVPFLEEILNKIPDNKLKPKTLLKYFNGECYTIKYKNLFIKKLRRKVLINLEEKNFLIKPPPKKGSILRDCEINIILKSKLLLEIQKYLINREENIFFECLIILLENVGLSKKILIGLKQQQQDAAILKIKEVYEKTKRGAGNEKIKSSIYAFLRLII